ncbi:MAG: hypothetical protein M3441_24940 [Chloroflexota bacterium]|nr:hypothetical protein [Chloroflexota bacterium]
MCKCSEQTVVLWAQRALLVLSLSLVAMAGMSGVAHTSYPGYDGKIAFLCRDNNPLFDICTANLDGSSRTNLTNDIHGQNMGMQWSPDGKKIVFERNDNTVGNHDIWVMNADGSNKTNLTNHLDGNGDIFNQVFPTWSPDGSKIAYIAYPSDGSESTAIHSINPDGTGDAILSNTAKGANSLDWGISGKLVYSARGETAPGSVYLNRDIYSINADGTNEANLTNSPLPESYPSWHPNGDKIVFNARAADDRTEIATMDSNGGNKAVVSGSGSFPKWSPSGRRIIFADAVDAQADLLAMDIDGSNRVNVTNSATDELYPDWQPVEECGVSCGEPVAKEAGKNKGWGDGNGGGKGHPKKEDSGGCVACGD